MVQSPIKLPAKAGLLDLLGPPILTEPAAEKILCAGMMLGDQFGDGTAVEAWGDNGEVWLDYDPATMAGKVISVWPGYTGTAQATSRDGMHFYTLPLNTQITKDGQPFTLDWTNMTTFKAEVNELHDALLATYAPSKPSVPDCYAANACAVGMFGDAGYVYFKPVGLAIWVASVSQPQPVQSIPNRMDLYPGQ